MAINNGVKIGNINGAEIIKANNGQQYEINYNCVLNNSLTLDKLKELGLNVNRIGRTKDVINVKFDYGYKAPLTEEESAKVAELNAKLAEKSADKEALTTNINSVEVEKNAIQGGKKLSELDAKTKAIVKAKIAEIKGLKESRKAINSEIKDIKEEIAGSDRVTKRENLRDKLYREGFNLTYKKAINGEEVAETIHYVFWVRSAGKAKMGECLYIRAELKDKIDVWQKMGITDKEIGGSIVEIEVYKSLTSSSITDYYVCKPEEILIVRDLDSYSEPQDVIKVVRDAETGYSKAIRTKERCKNTLFDGMALIQTENGMAGFRGLRQHFYKTGAFVADFQAYFRDYYGDRYETATITDMFGREVKVSDIKMITTENAIKWLKFLPATEESFNRWAEYVRENGSKFGICKSDHKSKYGKKQKMSYQMVNTLPISREGITELFKDSLDFITALQNDNDKFIAHLRRTATDVNNNALLADLAETYPSYVNSEYFKENRRVEINKCKDDLKAGHILVEGDNETIVANPMLLLEYVTGQIDDYIKDGVISGYIDKTLQNINSCYCRRFKDGEKLVAFRSPHNSPNNIAVLDNRISEDMDKYFWCLGDNVMAVNCIGNNFCDRLNGADFDTDFVMATNNSVIVEACADIITKYPTIVNGFTPSKKKYNNTMEDLAIIDNGLQSSQLGIGESSNVAQLYLSQYWDLLAQGKVEEAEELIDNVAILSVIAQVFVDSCKRAFNVGNGDNGASKEVARIRKQLPKQVKPLFWQYASPAFNKDAIERKLKAKDKDAWKELSADKKRSKINAEKRRMIHELADLQCPMDWVLKEIDKIKRGKRSKTVDNAEFLAVEDNREAQNRKQADKIEQLGEELDKEIEGLLKDKTIDREGFNQAYVKAYKEYIGKISKLKIRKETMLLILNRIFNKENKNLKDNTKIRTKLLNLLYRYSVDRVKTGKAKENIFLSCFNDIN